MDRALPAQALRCEMLTAVTKWRTDRWDLGVLVKKITETTWYATQQKPPRVMTREVGGEREGQPY